MCLFSFPGSHAVWRSNGQRRLGASCQGAQGGDGQDFTGRPRHARNQHQENEDIFRIRAVDMDWDIGVMVYDPEDPSENSEPGPTAKKRGSSCSTEARAITNPWTATRKCFQGKFGYKVVSMTFPGRLYLLDPSRDWPGDTLNPDGTARTPLWSKESKITPDQYRIVKDQSKRKLYGTFISLEAKEGTEFYYRMAGWPVAFDEGIEGSLQTPSASGSIFDLHPWPFHRWPFRLYGLLNASRTLWASSDTGHLPLGTRTRPPGRAHGTFLSRG